MFVLKNDKTICFFTCELGRFDLKDYICYRKAFFPRKLVQMKKMLFLVILIKEYVMDEQITQDNFRIYLATFCVNSNLNFSKVAKRLKIPHRHGIAC